MAPSNMLSAVYKKFFRERTSPPTQRFTGLFRALVVETNDPLNMYRVKFRCPDLHNADLSPADCPWAVPSPDLGVKRHGRWSHPCIGDWVWISFERNHPYGPVWVGHASPTRRKFYPLASVFQPTPVSVNDQGQPVGRPDDFSLNYLPKDGRPMSHGWQDRYGNLDIHSGVGFFPNEHRGQPPPPDFDAIQNAVFQQQQVAPEVNAPDLKYMARITKYGTMVVMGDQGYWWKKTEETGEFTGDTNVDESFEINRWKYLQRLINEDRPSGGDQRHYLVLTRYGTKFELRDTGWAQPGPVISKSRLNEYGVPVFLSKENVNDFRWAKLRTKGGWLLQAYDKGYDPQNDEYISRLLMDEVGAKSEQEDVHWANKDARWFRFMGRHFKIVIDERGTDPSRAASQENPRGNGILFKGRRTPGCKADGAVDGDPRGFYWEFNENDDGNHTTWGTPLGQVVELNDATEYAMFCVGLGPDYSRPWMGVKENEFLLEPTRARDPEQNAYHFVLDHENEYLRMKTRAGRGVAARNPVNPSGLVPASSIHQGLEAHDGQGGDGPWTEIVDADHRGLWFSKNQKLGIWRSKQDKKLYVWIDDDNNQLVIRNDEANGRIQIFCENNIEIITKNDITFHGKNINFKADEKIRFQAGNTPLTLSANRLETRAEIFGARANLTVVATPRPGGDTIVDPVEINVPVKVEPTDRATKYNVPSVMAQAEVEHPIL